MKHDRNVKYVSIPMADSVIVRIDITFDMVATQNPT